MEEAQAPGPNFIELLTVKHRERHANLPAVIGPWCTIQGFHWIRCAEDLTN